MDGWMGDCLRVYLNLAGAKEGFASPKLQIGGSSCKINSPPCAPRLGWRGGHRTQPKVRLGDQKLKLTNTHEIFFSPQS